MLTLSPLEEIRENPLDEEKIQTFFRENLSLVYRYVYSKVGNKEEAEDLTSQIFLKVVSSIDYARGRQSMQQWLYLIARTTIADYWRAYYRLPISSLDELLDVGLDFPADEEPRELINKATERVQFLLQALPERYREVLQCRFLLHLSIKATAIRMGLTAANVKVLQYRALKRAAELEQVVTEQLS